MAEYKQSPDKKFKADYAIKVLYSVLIKNHSAFS